MDTFNTPRQKKSSINPLFYAPRNSISHVTNLSTINSSHEPTITKQFFDQEHGPIGFKSKRMSLKCDFGKSPSAKLTASWIERVFEKRECVKFIQDGNTERCGCGRFSSAHSRIALSRFTTSMIKENPSCQNDTKSPTTPILESPLISPVTFNNDDEFSNSSMSYIHDRRQSSCGDNKRKWNISQHTQGIPTDAFGTIVFQAGPHPHKAHYVRLSFDSDPADIVYLMEKIWNLPKPKLVISIHGGVGNFSIPDTFGKKFREGLLKAAQTTGAWIITSGINSGVVRHVAQALDEAGISARMRSQILLIGIAPWGLVRKRDKLVGIDSMVTYDYPSYSQKNRHHLVLNDRHSYFLLVDNGTVGRYGADIILRKRFEDYLAQKVTFECGNEKTPLIGVTVEGGLCTINSVLQYVSGSPPVPVIVCEGSGRASDLIAFAEQHADDRGNLDSGYRNQLKCMVRDKLSYNHTSDENIVALILECVKHKDLLTVYRGTEGEEDGDNVDKVILRALLKGDNLSLVEQLSLTLAWNRCDIARSEVFNSDQDIPPQALYPVMMSCLLTNRVNFFKLLIEQGVSMKKFLTISRLEHLYNAEPEQLSTLYHLLGDADGFPEEQGFMRFTLPQIGYAIEALMGNAYRCHYTSRTFKSKYDKYKSNHKQLSKISSFHLKLNYKKGKDKKDRNQSTASEPAEDFSYPFNELLIWAVLTRRHELAKCIWNHGEEAMAKALVAISLYRNMGKLAARDYTEIEISNQLIVYAEDFRECTFELLNHCYHQDDVMTMRLMTAELPNWGHQTCLSLAVISNNKRLLTHPCCQVLLAELWHGGLRFRSQSNIKVILAVLFPPSILLLDFVKPNYQSKNRNPSGSLEESEDEEGGTHFNLSLGNLFKNNGNNITTKLLRKRTLTRFSRAETDTDTDNPLSPSSPAEFIQMSEMETKRALSDKDKFRDSVFRRNLSQISSHHSSNTWKSWIRECSSKISLFYRAPITSFWIWAISFLVFLFAFIYVLLIEFPQEVTYLEWYLLAYVTAFSLEHFRKLLQTESSSQMEKIRVFYTSYWNLLTTIAILTFYLGYYFRRDHDTVHTYSRIILASNSVLWHMKLYDYMSVHPKVGPYIMMAGKMIRAMSYIIAMLLVTLMAFGVARQSITFPHEKWNWLLVRNIFYKPYFMLYGEVYAGEIDTCGDEGTNCVPGGWIPPILMTIFLLVSNILLINMLVAIFNNIFNVTNAVSHQVWMFQRYGQLVEYKSTPILPPPFTPLIHLWMLLKLLYRKIYCGKKRKNSATEIRDTGLELAIKVYLDEDELQKIRDFEEDCMDDLARRTEFLQIPSQRKRVVTDLAAENLKLKHDVDSMKQQLDAIQASQERFFQLIQENNCPNTSNQPQNAAKNGPINASTSVGSTSTPVFTGSSVEAYNQSPLVLEMRRKRLEQNAKKSVSLSEDMEQMAQMNSSLRRDGSRQTAEDEDAGLLAGVDPSIPTSSSSSRSSSISSVVSLNSVIIK